MPEFYYQIKGKNDSYEGWGWPPIFSGKVSADNKKLARKSIEEEYGRQFPMRVLEKDLKDEHYLLHIRQIEKDDHKTKSLFELNECMNCQKMFRTIDLYNDHNERYKGNSFCSYTCKEQHRLESQAFVSSHGNSYPVIYRVLNNVTGKSYIGKTTQVFTLRWYQHFFQTGSCKFHQAIKESNVSDWQFMIIEKCNHDELDEKERHWISHFNAIEDGYNSI